MTQFTQQDINDERLQFTQNGQRAPSAFYFSVTDGRFTPYFKTFNIRVDPLMLKLTAVRNLEIVQGQVSVVLRADSFDIETNGNLHDVMFNVSQPPMHGDLYMENEQAFQFSYKHLQNGDVNYVQTNMRSVADTFEFTLYDKYNSIYRKRMNIKVVPLVRSTAEEPMTLKPGQSATISLRYLDASELAAMTQSVPVYKIETVPTHGSIVKLHRKPRVKRQVTSSSTTSDDDVEYSVVRNFTHDDVANNVIQYRANDARTYTSQQDSFGYRLVANNVQPAPGVFRLTLAASHQPTTALTTPAMMMTKKGAGNSGGGDSSGATDVMVAAAGSKAVYIVIIVVVLVLLLILMCLVYYCYKRNRRQHLQKKRQYMLEAEERKALRGGGGHADDGGRVAPPNVYTDPYRNGSRNNGHHVPLRHAPQQQQPVSVIITSDLEECKGSSSDGSLYDRQMMTHHPNHQHQHQQQSRRHPMMTHASLDRSDYGTGSPTHTPELERARSLDDDSSPSPPPPPPPSGDYNRAGSSVPTCKVTPLCDSQDSVHQAGALVTHDRMNTGGGGAKAGKPRIDLDSMDPELLQHYRKTNPVLHKTKHWV